MTQAVRFAPGHRLGDFEVLGVLGRGGMGEVYRARDERLGREVAIKVLPAAVAGDVERLRRFEREARVLAALNHPNIATVYDLREEHGLPLLVLELVEGDTLDELVARETLAVDEILGIFVQIADAVASAHDRGIVHRDLKPANVKVTPDGAVKVLDFGLAKMVDQPVLGEEDSTLTRLQSDSTANGVVLGTLSYMSPEQARGLEVDRRTDIWSYAATLYFALTGKAPFTAASAADTLARLLNEEPDWEALPADLPGGVQRVLRRGLEKDLRRRLRDAGDVALELREALAGVRGSAVEESIEDWRPCTGRTIPGRPQWQLEALLGEGGFGEVWLGKHLKTGDRRVFKFCFDPDRIRALQREVVLFRLLKESLGSRDDIARILDWEFERPPYFLEAEYSEGGNLVDWAAEQGGIEAVPLDLRLELVAQAATALAAAHSVGVLHKDIKPANVLVSETSGAPRAVLTDFGIGLVTDPGLLQAGVTARGFTQTLLSSSSSSGGGTPLYMAPEVIEGKPATTQSDIYSLGVLLYQMVVGDLHRALAPGWEEAVPDELLREDVAGAVHGRPSERLEAASELAHRLRRLDERRRERAARREEQREAERLRQVAARARRRRRQFTVATAAGASLTLAVGLVALRERSARQHLEVAHYVSQIQLAAARVASDNAGLARQVLQETPAELRGWEWGFLAERAWPPLLTTSATAEDSMPDGSTAAERWRGATGAVIATLDPPPTSLLHVAWSPDGTRLATSHSGTLVQVLAIDPPSVVCTYDRYTAAWVVQFSPDGSRLAVAGAGGWVVLLDAATCTRLGAWRSGYGWVDSVSFSPDGRYLLRSSFPESLELLDLETGETVDGLPGTMVAPNGAQWREATRSDARFPWELTLGRLPSDLSSRASRWSPLAEEAPLVDLVVDPDTRPAGSQIVGPFWSGTLDPRGDLVYFVSNEGSLRAWDLERGVLRYELPGTPADPVEQISNVTRDGSLVATSRRDNTITLWDAPSGSPLTTLEGLPVGSGWTRLRFSDDGSRLAVVEENDAIRILAPGRRAGSRPEVLGGHRRPIYQVRFSPDGGRVAFASFDGTVSVWSVRTGVRELTLRHDGEVGEPTFTPDGTGLLTWSWDRTIRLWELSTGKEVERWQLAEGFAPPPLVSAASAGRGLQRVALSPDGRRVALPEAEGGAVFDLGSGERLFPLASGEQVLGGRYTPDGTRIVLRLRSRDRSAGLGVADAATGNLLCTLDGTDEGSPFANGPFSRYVVTRMFPSDLGLWDLETCTERRRFKGHTSNVFTIVFDPTGSFLASSADDRSARLWDVETGAQLVRFDGHSDLNVLDAALSPDGERILSYTLYEAKIWDRAGNELLTLPLDLEFLNGIVHAAWSPDGHSIAVGLSDGSARLFRAPLRQDLTNPGGEEEPIEGALARWRQKTE